MIKIGKRFENFANSVKSTLDELEYLELEGVSVIPCAKEGFAFEDDEEGYNSNLYYLEIKMPNDVIIYHSKEYSSERSLLDDKDSIIKEIKELFNDKRSHFEIMFLTQQIPFEENSSIPKFYNSYAKMINSYENYLSKMNHLFASKRIFNDKIHKKITILKELFVKNLRSNWIYDGYKFSHSFDSYGKCHLKVYSDKVLVATISN